MAVRTLRNYAITALLVLVIGLFSAASWRTEVQQHGQDAIADRQTVALATITANSDRLSALLDKQCADRNASSSAINELIDGLIVSVQASTTISEESRRDKVARYVSSKVSLVDCGSLK